MHSEAVSSGNPISAAFRSLWRSQRLAARLQWLVGFAFTVSVFVPGIVYNYGYRLTDAITLYQPALEQIGLSPHFYAAYMTTLESIMALVFLISSTVVFWRRQDSPIALVMSLVLMTYGTTQGPSVFILAGAFEEWSIPVASLWMLRALSLLLLFFLFPDGRFIPSWSRWLLLPYMLWETLHAYVVFMHMGLTSEQVFTHELFLLVAIGFYFFGFGTQVYRYRKISNSIERQQSKWVIVGIAIALIGNGTFLALEFGAPALMPQELWTAVMFRLFYRMGVNLILIYLPVTLAPIFLSVAILRYRLWDIDIVINRALVYSALTAIVASIYIFIVGSMSLIFQTQTNLLISMVPTAVIAVLFHPLRERLQRAVNHLMYGERDDPYAVISHLGKRLQGALDPHRLLPEICQTVAQALRIPFVAIEVRQGEDYQPAASYGIPSRDSLVLPLSHQGETIGRMLIEPGNKDESFIRADWRLLSDVALHAGIGVHIMLLTYDLQRSRQSLVTTREEERRRLRRDLHDGLGPMIASMTLKVDAAQNLLKRDPQRANALLNDLRAQSQAVLGDVRRIAYELRPPVLDELGITEALREFLHALNTANESDCSIKLDAPEHRLMLPAAAEVAVYRIATEAITNVLRHASAQHCCIRLTCTDKHLSLEITDDGKGISVSGRRGVGLASMHERAAELNGTFTLKSEPGSGTCIQVVLPV